MPTEILAPTDLKKLASHVLARALKAGATDAEAVVYEGDEFAAMVRLGQVETLKESGSRAVGLRVFIGHRPASTSSSDFPSDSLPPEPSEIARRTEAAAMAYDPRIQNSGGGDFDTATSHKILMNSRGFTGEYRRSYCGFSAAPIAHDEKGNMQRNYWFSNSRTVTKLENPEEIGQEAARRTLKRLGARQVKTQKAPVVFSPEIARSIIGNIFDAANGDAIYRNASFFSGMLGEQVAGENITVIDDGTIIHDGIGGFGTRPFDGEGLPSRRTVLVERGILKNYVLNTYTARKLHMQSTGNASRGLAGNPGIGAGNFFLEPGTLTPEQIIADVKTGLYVTETMGHGVNLVTGDYSHGASGLWIENGEIAYPVEEITIAGNLKDMYKNIVAIGNDLVFHGASAAPTLRIEGMTIAGS